MSTEEEVEAVKAATREAHETLKDLRAERRAVADLIDGIEARVGDRINSEVTRQVGILGEETGEAMRKSVEKVGREFDRLADLYMKGEQSRRRGDRLSLDELTTMHQLVERHERTRS